MHFLAIKRVLSNFSVSINKKFLIQTEFVNSQRKVLQKNFLKILILSQIFKERQSGTYFFATIFYQKTLQHEYKSIFTICSISSLKHGSCLSQVEMVEDKRYIDASEIEEVRFTGNR